jgi:hypothetical protein
MKQVMLMIGTRKGGFLAFSDVSRKHWEMPGPVFKGVEVNCIYLTPGSPPVIYMAGTSAWWGPAFSLSRDFGHTWVEPTAPVRFPDGRGLSLERRWPVPTSSGHPSVPPQHPLPTEPLRRVPERQCGR